ncbi:hypothetical protein FQR65_LT02262 [Abscondita terminalis]|nr:hypothetical protein FQR65_LT02262 [Abscondita terminalis]
MSTAEQVMPVVLKPEDVPGAVLQQNLRIEDHSNFQLQRWLECRSLKKTGTKAELVQRVYDCINAGREEYIFLGIDNGKWYDVKRNLTHNIAASVPQTVSKWIKFPSRDIPKYFNKGHVYSYLVGNNFETEEFEITINETGITEKPFKGVPFIILFSAEIPNRQMFQNLSTRVSENGTFPRASIASEKHQGLGLECKENILDVVKNNPG